MKHECVKLVIMVVILFISPASNTVHADLIALWEFDYGSATDSYGENHGTLNGYPDFSAGPSDIGRALELSDNDYVSIANERNFDITNEITVAAWIKVNRFDKQWQAIVTKGDSAWRLARTENEKTLAFHLTGVTSDNKGTYQNLGIEGNMDVEDGQWHHVTGVYNGSKIYLYVDGILDKSINASGTIATNNYEVYIGENAEQTGRYFNGLIDNVIIFDHALSKEEVKQLYTQGSASFIPNGYVAKLTEETENIVKKLKPEEAVVIIERKISDYERWRITNLSHIKPCDKRISSDIYVLLARAKEAAHASIRDVVSDYKRSISQPQIPSKYIPAALLWLFEKTQTDEYLNVVRECVYNSDNPYRNVYDVARYFESKENWAAFRHFLDAIFSEGNNVTSYARAVANSLEEDGMWAKKFLEYCRRKPEMTEYLFYKHEKIARNYMLQKNFQKAIDIYRDIFKQCGPDQNKSPYEFKVCECLFNDHQYKNVIPKLESFIRNNRATNRVLISKAIILKGQAYIQLGDIDRAKDEFVTLIIEYPEAKQAPEANFFVGYCYMLQGKFDEATESFNLVVKDYPESSYVDKARSSVSRIKSMTE